MACESSTELLNLCQQWHRYFFILKPRQIGGVIHSFKGIFKKKL